MNGKYSTSRTMYLLKKKHYTFYEKLLQVFAGFVATISLNACSTMEPCTYHSPAEEAAKHVPRSSLSGVEKEQYEEVQKRIGTNKDFLYHDAVVEPKVFKSPYPFYLLGFEKPNDHSLSPYCRSNEVSCKTPKFEPGNFKGDQKDELGEIVATQNDIEKNISEKPLVLTHVLNAGKQDATIRDKNGEGCFIFNVYGHDTQTPWCQNNHKINVLKRATLAPDWKREGWKGLDRLAADIKERAASEKATHIILLATGWNTRQYESYLDFKAWMDILTKNFKNQRYGRPEDFRPIFIGISWQSEWPWWEHIPFVSEFTKGNDADEIGFTWGNYLLNDLLRPLAKLSETQPEMQLVFIGHSFGSRIALGAHYTRNIIVRHDPVAATPVTIIGIQAAFPITRFVTTKGKEHQYAAANKNNATVAITSSSHDEAAGKMCAGTAYIGASCGLEEIKEKNLYKDFVTVLTVGHDGAFSNPDTRRVSVYDASSFVGCQLQGTQGGAHSDVYDDSMGMFLVGIIRNSKKIYSQ